MIRLAIPGLILVSFSSLVSLLWQEQSRTGTEQSLRFQEAPEAWIAVFLVLPLLALVSWISYRKENLSRAWRITLASLRFAAMAVLFLVLCRPVMVERREEIHPPEVVVLIDDSASMRRTDAYTGDEDARAVVRELVADREGGGMRYELVGAAVDKVLRPALDEQGYELRLFRFSDRLVPLAGTSELSGGGHATHLGDALNGVLASHRGRHVTDVVVFSDGRSNGGHPPIDAARAAGAAGIPVHTVVVGDTRPERNAILELVEAPRSALELDELAITVRVLGRGTRGLERTQVILEELGGEEGGGEFGTRLVSEEEVELSENGERVVLVAPPGAGVDNGSGNQTRRFRVSIPPLDGETLLDDNQREFSVPISRQKVRVLYVDGYPRWEYRRLALDLLKRSDENIEFQCFLLSATPNFPQESAEGLPPLESVPTERRALLDNYDVIILGDLNPADVSPDPVKQEEFLASLREFVESGGGLLFQAGPQDNPRTFDERLLELMPVVVEPAELLGWRGETDRVFHPTLEDPVQPHEIVRLHAEGEINRRLWEDDDGLHGFYWFSPVSRAKPGAQVLLRHPWEQNQNGRYPLLVAGYFPAGRTLFLGMDSTWRWYWRYGRRYHERFWRNAIRWLALGRLKSGDRRYRLEATRGTYNLDDRITLEARVLDEDYHPSDKPTHEARWSGPDSEGGDVTLAAVPGKSGIYRATFEAERPGTHRAWIEKGGQSVSTVEFEVVLPSRENADPSPDPETLSGVARLAGGRTVDMVHVSELLREFPGGEERHEPISSELEDAWDRWSTLLFVLGLLGIEWVLRKRVELV